MKKKSAGKWLRVGKWLLLSLLVVGPAVALMPVLMEPVPYELGMSHKGELETKLGKTGLMTVLQELDGVKTNESHQERYRTHCSLEYRGSWYACRMDHPKSHREVLARESAFLVDVNDTSFKGFKDPYFYQRTGDFSTTIQYVPVGSGSVNETEELSRKIHAKILGMAEVKYRPRWKEWVEKIEVRTQRRLDKWQSKMGEWWRKVVK